jgi:hypothetical protein
MKRGAVPLGPSHCGAWPRWLKQTSPLGPFGPWWPNRGEDFPFPHQRLTDRFRPAGGRWGYGRGVSPWSWALDGEGLTGVGSWWWWTRRRVVLLEVLGWPKEIRRQRLTVRFMEEGSGTVNLLARCCWLVARARRRCYLKRGRRWTGSLAWMAMRSGGGVQRWWIKRRARERWSRGEVSVGAHKMLISCANISSKCMK